MLGKMLNRVRKNNKGFSLVELIVVIAIMAVLIAILAPQFLKYVEKSREAKDLTNADEILRAVQTAMENETVYAKVASGQTVKWSASGVDVTGVDTTLADEMAETLGPLANVGVPVSMAHKNGTYTVTITITTTGPTATQPARSILLVKGAW